MKKLFVIALAAFGMVACMNDEITELPSGNEISFDNAFIDNATRAELTAANLGEFKVWGYIDGLGDADNQQVALFEGETVSNATGAWQYGGGARYWAPEEMHYFEAVAPLTAAVSVVADATNSGKISTIEYTVDGESDLIYAAYSKQAASANQDNGPVSFTFDHLLSRVMFTFNNGFAAEDGISLTIKNVKMTVPASGTYSNGAWTVNATNSKVLENIEGSKFVLPYNNTYAYAIEFDVDVLYKGAVINKDVHKTSTVVGVALEQGKSYNFTATIDEETLNMESIEFTVGNVEGWITGGDTIIGAGAAVSTADALQAALADPDINNIVLTDDIDLTESLIFGAPVSRAATTINGRNITIDGNGTTLTYTGNNARIIDVTNDANGMDLTLKNLTIINDASYCQRGINYNTNGTLTLENVTIKSAEDKVISYAVNFPGSSNEAKANITGSDIQGLIALNVWGSNMVINVEKSDLLSLDNATHENYATISLNDDGTTSADRTVVNVYGEGSSIKAYDENGVPSVAIRISALTGEVNYTEDVVIVGDELRPVATVQYEGYSEFYSCHTLQDAIDNVVKNDSGYIVLIRDIELTESIRIPAGEKVSIDLNGKKIIGTDNATASFGLITNNGELTLYGGGEMTLVATNNRAWNAYSSVVSNNPGGKLTVEDGVVIEHLGGTDMAYGIDNLTNGKGTYAETIVNDATVKSTYRAIRQFLNGIEAQNILTVNDGAVIEGANKSIWMQDPSKNANTGKLVVNEGAQLKGDVYLFVTEGSTEWPVEVSIAASTLVGESEVLTKNVPEGKAVLLINGYYTIVDVTVVEDNSGLSSATIEDGATIVLAKGSYTIPDSAKGKTLTIVGTGNPEDTTVAQQNRGAGEGNGDYCFDGATVTFENVTITTEGTYFPGYVRMKGTFNNCIINGVYTLYDDTTFNNCTFNISGDLYNVWTWGATNATFNNCTFNCDGKAVLLYGTVNTKLTLNDCTFNDNGGLTDLKAAVEIGNDYGKSYELIVNNATVNGFEINDKGINTGTTLWGNKNSMSQDVLNVVVDGVDVY